jgi:rhodanese-related sulfurtransferase
MKQLHVSELSRWLGQGAEVQPQLLDVREAWELEIARLPGTIHIPMREIPARWRELDKSRPLVCVCHHGVRSLQVAVFLARHGFDPIYNLVGGIDAWAREVDLQCPTY